VITILLIWLYTFRGGIKTIIWTDTLQTFFLLMAMVMSLVLICQAMELDFTGMVRRIAKSDYSRMFFFKDWKSETHFIKQFLSGAFVALAMTGLDQDMMQKNLSCRNLKDAQKNMSWMGLSLVPVNLLFLSLGALLYMYASQNSVPIPDRSDEIFPLIATRGYLPPAVTIFFMIGLIAAAFSSADSALTALTTSFTVDILNGARLSERQLQRLRKTVHIGVSAVVLLVVIMIRIINDESVISAIIKVAGYTYGPLLGFFFFGLFTPYEVKDRWMPFVAVASPVLCYFISANSESWLNGYTFGFELLILNGLLTFIGLLLIRRN
jgi:Na+/proline symporter